MARTITKEEAVGAFGDILGSLSRDEETVIVDERGDRVAVVVSPEEFDKLSYERFWATVDRIRERNADKDPETVFKDITEIVEEVRKERYEQQRTQAQSGDRH